MPDQQPLVPISGLLSWVLSVLRMLPIGTLHWGLWVLVICVWWAVLGLRCLSCWVCWYDGGGSNHLPMANPVCQVLGYVWKSYKLSAMIIPIFQIRKLIYGEIAYCVLILTCLRTMLFFSFSSVLLVWDLRCSLKCLSNGRHARVWKQHETCFWCHALTISNVLLLLAHYN